MSNKLQDQKQNYLQEIDNFNKEIKGSKTKFLHSIKQELEISLQKKLSFTTIALLIQKHFKKKISANLIRDYAKKYLHYKPRTKTQKSEQYTEQELYITTNKGERLSKKEFYIDKQNRIVEVGYYIKNDGEKQQDMQGANGDFWKKWIRDDEKKYY